MDATPERQLGGALQADVEPGGAEDPRVGVRRGDEHGEKGAGRDPQALELEVLGGDPPDDRDRGPHPHDLLDRPRRERGRLGEPRPLGRMLRKVASAQPSWLRVVSWPANTSPVTMTRSSASLSWSPASSAAMSAETKSGPGAARRSASRSSTHAYRPCSAASIRAQVLGHGIAEGEAQIGGPAVELRVALARDAEQLRR